MRQSTYLNKVIAKLYEAGYWISGVSDGEVLTRFKGTTPLVKRKELAMNVIKSVEDGVIYFENSNSVTGYLVIVWQGPDETYEDGEEIVSDHTVNFSDIINSIEGGN